MSEATRTVWNYKLEPQCTLKMPRGAKVLHVHEQAGDICLWALVDPHNGTEPRRFVVMPTGGEMVGDAPQDLKYRGTAHLEGGALVFHVFEVPTP